MTPRQLHPLSEQIGREKVEQIVAAFYERLRADALLASFFPSGNALVKHEQRVADFWWIAMGGTPPSREVSFDMVGDHAHLQLNVEHFECWLAHPRDTLEDQLEPPLAATWMRMAEGIASRLRMAIGRLQD